MPNSTKFWANLVLDLPFSSPPSVAISEKKQFPSFITNCYELFETYTNISFNLITHANFGLHFNQNTNKKLCLDDPWCMIKIFRGEGVVDGEEGSSEGCLKWGGGGH